MNRSEQFWDRQAASFDSAAPTADSVDGKTLERTRRYLNANDVVLDFGCGTGVLSMELVEDVHTIHALDTSPEMIAIARRKAHERGITRVDFARATLFDARYAVNSYDVVLGFNVLHLLPDVAQVLPRLNALLKPGGLFISTTACLGESPAVVRMLLRLLGRTGLVPRVKVLTLAELSALLRHEDFQTLEVQQTEPRIPNYFIAARKGQGTL